MKIHYTMFEAKLTGGTRVIMEIANGLAERGHEVLITSMGSPADISWFPLKAKIEFIPIPLATKAVRKGLRRLLNLETYPEHEISALASATPECDVNIATFCFTALSVFRSGKGMPVYHMQHYEPLFFEDDYLKKLAEETYYLPLSKIANSSWLKQELEEKHSLKNIETLFPAMHHSVFFPRERRGGSNKKRIISLAKDVKWKGFDDVIETLRIILKERSDVELLCFGTNPPQVALAGLPVRVYQSVINEELAQLYCECDVLLSASWYESFPLPPLEAMACGVPVVTTRYGTEDYCIDGKNCVVVPERDPEAMATAILELFENEGLRRKLIEEGIRTAKQFTWDRTVDKAEEIIRFFCSQ